MPKVRVTLEENATIRRTALDIDIDLKCAYCGRTLKGTVGYIGWDKKPYINIEACPVCIGDEDIDLDKVK